jgi:hypothetical protein
MVGAGYIIEFVFGDLGLIPDRAAARVAEAGISWNYTTWLNIVFIAAAAILATRFVRTGGMPMLRMMRRAPGTEGNGHAHEGHGAPADHRQ